MCGMLALSTDNPVEEVGVSTGSFPAEHIEGRLIVSEEELQELRDTLAPGSYLVYNDGTSTETFAIGEGWVRIGRSLSADIRFEDPGVSRRHALVVRQPDGIRAVDDRSLNGIFLNSERVEWSVLEDGDQLTVGRHVIHFLDLHEESGLAAA